MTILDSSALLALLQDEPGGDRVTRALTAGATAMSAANIAEVLALFAVRLGVVPADTRAVVQKLGITVLDVTEEIAVRSAHIAIRYPRSGLSLGDRLCIATGLVHACRILSADRVWLTLTLDADIETIRP